MRKLLSRSNARASNFPLFNCFTNESYRRCCAQRMELLVNLPGSGADLLSSNGAVAVHKIEKRQRVGRLLINWPIRKYFDSDSMPEGAIFAKKMPGTMTTLHRPQNFAAFNVELRSNHFEMSRGNCSLMR